MSLHDVDRNCTAVTAHPAIYCSPEGKTDELIRRRELTLQRMRLKKPARTHRSMLWVQFPAAVRPCSVKSHVQAVPSQLPQLTTEAARCRPTGTNVPISSHRRKYKLDDVALTEMSAERRPLYTISEDIGVSSEEKTSLPSEESTARECT